MSSEISESHQAIGSRSSKVIVLATTASASTTSGESAFDGRLLGLKTLKSSTTTKETNDNERHYAPNPSG